MNEFNANEMKKLADLKSRDEELKSKFIAQIKEIAEDGDYYARYKTDKLSRREVIMLSAWLTDCGFRVIVASHDATKRIVVWGDEAPQSTDMIQEIFI